MLKREFLFVIVQQSAFGIPGQITVVNSHFNQKLKKKIFIKNLNTHTIKMVAQVLINALMELT